MTIYLIRHGETDFNKKRIIQGSGVDSDLNETGRAQGRAFFEKYKDLGFQTVITSALKRTHQTVADFIDTGINWEQHPDINEMNWGVHEGKPGTPEMRENYKTMIGEWAKGNFDYALQDGESAAQLGTRIGRFLEHLKTRKEEKLLVCSHGRAIRCFVALMKQQPLQAMETVAHANTGLYLSKLDAAGFTFLLENDTEHLGVKNE